jgi:hypothetical protein
MGFLQNGGLYSQRANTRFVAKVQRIDGQAALAFQFLAHAGSRISNLFDDALEKSLAGDFKMLRPVFNFSLVFHGNLAAVGRR